MTLRQTIDAAVARLSPAVMDAREARACIEMALEAIKGWSRTDIAIRSADEAGSFVADKLNAVTDRLMKHEPIQYVIGFADFYGLKIKVDPSVLIPRPETAGLVDMIVADADGRADLRVLDLCTGSGCIALALARTLRFAQVTAIDLSDKALATARENVAALRTKVTLRQADVLTLAPEPDSYDIIVSNPPYVAESERAAMEPNVLDYEPAMALFVPDDDPLRFYRAISAFAVKSLVGGGRIYLEINPLFVAELRDMMSADGWSDITVSRDCFGKERFISAIRP